MDFLEGLVAVEQARFPGERGVREQQVKDFQAVLRGARRIAAREAAAAARRRQEPWDRLGMQEVTVVEVSTFQLSWGRQQARLGLLVVVAGRTSTLDRQ